MPADTIDAITEIKSTLKSGADATLITGTKGTDGNLASWNADGDLVDSSKSTSDLTQSFGSWASRNIGQTYQAGTDGFVTVYTTQSQNTTLHIYSDSSSSPSTIRSAGRHDGIAGQEGLMIPVKKDDYYKVTSTGSTTGNETMFWIPLS